MWGCFKTFIVARTNEFILIPLKPKAGPFDFAQVLRMREIGICVALGASRRRFEAGAVEGVSADSGRARFRTGADVQLYQFIATQLYGIGANDPLTLIAVVERLAAMSLLACYMPAKRATRVDPVAAIR